MQPIKYKRFEIKKMNNNQILDLQEKIVKNKRAYNSLSNDNKGLIDQFAPNKNVGAIQFEDKAKKMFTKRLQEIRAKNMSKTMKKSKSKSMNKSQSQQNNSKNSQIINSAPIVKEADTKTLIDRVFEERKFTKLLNKYQEDLARNDRNKSFWKTCSEIQKIYPNYFLPTIDRIPKSRNISTRPYKDDEIIVEEFGKGLSVMKMDEYKKMEKHINDPFKTERDTAKIVCYFMDIVGYVTHRLRQLNVPVDLILKGGRALQLLAGNKTLDDIKQQIEKMIKDKNANMDMMRSIVGDEFLESKLQFDSFDVDVILKSDNEENAKYAAKKLKNILESVDRDLLVSNEVTDKKIFKIAYHEVGGQGSGMTALADIGYGLPEGSTTAEYFKELSEHSFGEDGNKRLFLTQTLDGFQNEKDNMVEKNLENPYILKKALKSKVLSKMLSKNRTLKKKASRSKRSTSRSQ